ncbi:hypothetical protein U1Q18_050248 [Sarracenia purpurea var. burkii]
MEIPKVQDILEKQVLTVAKASEDKIDDEMAALDRLDLDDIEVPEPEPEPSNSFNDSRKIMWFVGEDEGTHIDGWVCWEVYSRVFAAVYSDPTKLGFSDLSVAVVDAAVPCSGATGAGIVLYALRGCFEVVSKEEEQQLVSWIVVIDGNNPNR